ncbi:hypothetical protein D3C87_1945390 [compost metagenome]
MMAVLDRQHAVITQAIYATPDHDVTMEQGNALIFVATCKAAEQEHRRQPQGYRNDGGVVGMFVFVLMQ